MISAVRHVHFNTPALVNPSSTVKVDGVLASISCSLSYPVKLESRSLRVQSKTTVLRGRADLRSSSSRKWQNLQCCKSSSSIFPFGHLTGLKDERNSNCRSRWELNIGCDGCHDHHEDDSPDEEEYCEPSCHNKEGRIYKKSKAPKECSKASKEDSVNVTGDANQECLVERSGGYTIYVSKELMGVFRYVEKVKRARTKDLAETLRKVSQACFLFSCVRGVLAPLVEVYKTSPPDWKKLLYMIGTFDSFALSYLAMKASEPLFQLSMLATETDSDMMGSIKREEEHMLTLAIELVKLFRRLRNVTLFIALTQFVQVTIQLRDPAFCSNVAKIFSSWFECPWGGS